MTDQIFTILLQKKLKSIADMKFATSKPDIPESPHYAVVRFSSIHIPGDERSRVQPGHGYPAETRKISEYIVFESRDELMTWIEIRELMNTTSPQKSDYCVIEAAPLRVTLNVSLG